MLKLQFFSDKQILQRIAGGDRQVLGTLYLRYERMAGRIIGRLGGRREDVQDMLQEALIVLWQKAGNPDFRLTSKLSTWLMAVVSNKYLAAQRKAHSTQHSDYPDWLPTGENDPEQELLASERVELMRQALQQISAVCRRLLELFYFEERSLRGIAAEMGFAGSDVVKAKKYQCKNALQKQISVLTTEQGGRLHEK